MASIRSALLALALAPLLLAAPASAQVIIQGEIVAQPAPQGQVQVQVQGQAPPGYVQPYVTTEVPPTAYVQQPQMMAQCPAGSQLMPNRWGQQVCMHEVTGHRAISGLLWGGVGLLAGGYVFEVFTTLFSGIVGAFAVDGTTYTRSQLDNYVTWGFIPVLGPWVQMGFAPPFADSSLYAILALEGLLQAGGITMMVFGIMGEEYTEWRPLAGVDLRVRPMLGSAQGLSAQLAF